MADNETIVAHAEAIAREAQRQEMNRIIRDCEKSNDVTLRSLARIYRMLQIRP